MNIVVCVKRVPITQEVDLEIDAGGKDVKKDALPFTINEWDNYALEEAVLLKERLGGTVTVVTVGGEDDEEVLRRAQAMGADRAIRVSSEGLELDPFGLAKVLAQVVRELDYDLILTGVQAEDDNYGLVGVMLAEHLGLPHAAVVTAIEPEGPTARIKVELEGGLDEISRINLPALLTIQTGINEPRYVSVMAVRKARKKELEVRAVNSLGLDPKELSPRIMTWELLPPPDTGGAVMLTGDPPQIADQIIRIVRETGVNL